MFFSANAGQKPHLYFGIGSPNLAKLLGLGQNRNSWSTQPYMTESVVPPLPGGGGNSLWVRRGCAPVLGSFWPENSGIGVSFYWKISVIGVYFHSEFSGIGGYSKFCNGC